MGFNNKGFSLVEVMVAVGLMSILALGMGTVINNFQKQVKMQIQLF